MELDAGAPSLGMEQYRELDSLLFADRFGECCGASRRASMVAATSQTSTRAAGGHSHPSWRATAIDGPTRTLCDQREAAGWASMPSMGALSGSHSPRQLTRFLLHEGLLTFWLFRLLFDGEHVQW